MIEGNKNKKAAAIKIFYHKPRSFSSRSKILLAIPGDGINGDGYRDALISAAEKYNVLLLSPQYLEKDYPFEAYQLGGTMLDMNIPKAVEPVKGTNIVNVDEAKLTFKPNNKSDEWIF